MKTMLEPTITQIKERQAELAETIQNLLNEFQEVTGTQVEDIHFEKIKAMGQPSKIQCVEIELHIK